GTELFTAVEVACGNYRSIPPPAPILKTPNLAGLDFDSFDPAAPPPEFEEYLLEVEQSAMERREPTFRFNFYHDLESLFWILAWFLHHRFPKGEWLSKNYPDFNYDHAVVKSRLRASFHATIYPVFWRRKLFIDHRWDVRDEMRSMFKSIYSVIHINGN
ncbi:hypothetical protein H0H92_014980, partial [Tricholoma furcatifolium]